MQRNIHQWIDRIAAFCGSVAFLSLNAAVFFVWIIVNTVFPSWMHYDAYPFQFLTFAVSLEAIFLSIFVLISQNRQTERDKAHEETERARQQKQLDEEIAINRVEARQEKEILAMLSSQNEALDELKQLVQVSKSSASSTDVL